MIEKKKWYQKTWFIILTLIFFFPVGIFLMWKYANWSSTIKWIVTAVIAIIALFSFFTDSTDNNQTQNNEIEKSTEEKTTEDKKNVEKKSVEEASKKIQKSKVETSKTMSEDEYKGVIKSYQMQIQLAGEDLQKLTTEMNDSGRLTNKGKDLVYAIYGGLDGADLILKGAKEKVIPPEKYDIDHQNLLSANEHFQNAARYLESYENSESPDDLNNALKELSIATDNADIDIRNILE